MPKRTPSPASSTHQLDAVRPIIRSFDDGPEVSNWMNTVREGLNPPIGLLDQLESAGWQHITVHSINEIVDVRKRAPIGYGAISKILGRDKGCELEVEITDTHGRKYQVALCRNEFTLLHGHTTNARGPERRVLIKLATTPAMFGGMLMATR